jgi:glycyl-tRNA synthetase (class II)
MKHYKDLEIVYEDRNELSQETEEELAHYCTSTVERAMTMLQLNNIEVKQAIYDRLYDIKKMSNDLRPYQRYSVLVLKYRSDIYPNRFVELF